MRKRRKVSRKKKLMKHLPKPKPPRGKPKLNPHHSLRLRKGQSLVQRSLLQEPPPEPQLKRLKKR